MNFGTITLYRVCLFRAVGAYTKYYTSLFISGTVNLAKLKEVEEKHEKINIEIRRSTTPGKRVILVQGPC